MLSTSSAYLIYTFSYFQSFGANKSWLEVQALSQRETLREAALHVPDIVIASKAKTTHEKYEFYFRKFVLWCKKHKLQYLPAKESTISVFISDLTLQGISSAVLDGYFYGIKWKHDLQLLDNPCDSKFVQMTYAGSKRMLSKPVVKKKPMTKDILTKIVDFYFPTDVFTNLLKLRVCTMCILGFAGFLRFNELSSLQMRDITFFEDHISLFIKKSKTDQIKTGSEVLIAKTFSKLCPVLWLNRYIAASGHTLHSTEYLFTKVRFHKSLGKHVLADTFTPLSYTRAREIFQEALTHIGEDKASYGLHSLRSGGATAVCNNADSVDVRLLNKHGRWKSCNSSDGYIHYNIENRLKVSKQLGL